MEVGTVITYGCEEGFKFSHDWYRNPISRITCRDDGLFLVPDVWPVCIYREL